MSEKIFKALDEAARSAAGIAQIASEVRRLAEARVSQRPAQGAHSTFANSENSVETHTASKQPAQGEALARVNVVDLGGGMTRLDWEDGNWWHRLAAGTHTLYTAPPAPSVPEWLLRLMDQHIEKAERDGFGSVHVALAACRAAMLAAAPEPRS